MVAKNKRVTLRRGEGPRLTVMDLVLLAVLFIALWRLLWPVMHPGLFQRLVSAQKVTLSVELTPMNCGQVRALRLGQSVQNTLLDTPLGTVINISVQPVEITTRHGPTPSSQYCQVTAQVSGPGQVYPDAVIFGGQRQTVGTILQMAIGPWQGTGTVISVNGRG